VAGVYVKVIFRCGFPLCLEENVPKMGLNLNSDIRAGVQR
jgi:hypothetical protein